MGFFDSHDTSNNKQEGNNSGGSVIDIQQSGEIPLIFWIGVFTIIAGILIYAGWRYNKTKNFKLRAKYGNQPKAYPQARPRDPEPSYGNPVDKYFLRRDRRRHQKNAIWGRMQEIDSSQEGDFQPNCPEYGQQDHSYVDKIKRQRPARSHPYSGKSYSPQQKRQMRNTIQSLKRKGVIARPGHWEDFLPANVNMHEVIDRLSRVAEQQRREREQRENRQNSPESTSSEESRPASPARQDMWIFKPQKANLALQHDGMYA